LHAAVVQGILPKSVDEQAVLAAVDYSVAAARPVSALGGFRNAWRVARELPEEQAVKTPEDEADAPSRRALAAASNDRIGLLALLDETPEDEFWIDGDELPACIALRQDGCSLSSVAVGAGALEMSKVVLEFCRAEPGIGALMMAIAGGLRELIRNVWNRPPAEERGSRWWAVSVAANRHRHEPLAWLLRDATDLERESLFEWAIRGHAADALVVALDEGILPWSWRTLELSSTWPVVARIERGDPPLGLSFGMGWLRFPRYSKVPKVPPPIVGEWSEWMTEAWIMPGSHGEISIARGLESSSRRDLLCSRVVDVVLPGGCIAIGDGH
jgi:hypothetical protein